MTVKHCRAKGGPENCKYHNAEMRAEKAMSRGNTSAYLTAMREMDEHRGIGRAEEAAFLPSIEQATVRDLQADRHHLIADYPTESTFDSTWTEDGYQDESVEETNTYTRFNVTGNLANRILRKIGRTDGKVTLTEATIPYWISEVTADTDYQFSVEVDGEKVWDSETVGYVEGPQTYQRPEGSFNLSYIGHLNAWLNA